MLRFCGKCGRKIPEGGSFCPACGAPVRPWTPEDERAWAGRIGEVPPESEAVSAETSPGASKVVIKTKEDTPEFEHYFNTPGDL